MKKDAAGPFSLDPCSNTLDETEEEVEENGADDDEVGAEFTACLLSSHKEQVFLFLAIFLV